MPVALYQALLTLKEHTYFASREVGILYETEPLIGNYALTYALGLCAAPYNWNGPPRYKRDLAPLNEQGIYVTPAAFSPNKLRYVFSQFNAQTDSYYFRFDQNAIATTPERTRAMNFPQNGKIRMLGLDSQAIFYLLSLYHELPSLPGYIRLGKFNSKARVEWERLTLTSEQPEEGEHRLADMLLNAADLPPALIASLRAFSVYNIYPAPLLSDCQMRAQFWRGTTAEGKRVLLPAGMRYGVDALA